MLLQASERYIFSVTYNNLFIIDATAEDSGMYMCSAKNLLGQVTQQCEIQVQDLTTEVRFLSISILSSVFTDKFIQVADIIDIELT